MPPPQSALMWQQQPGLEVLTETAAAAGQDEAPTCPTEGHREGGCCFLLPQSSSVSPEAHPEDASLLHQCLGAAFHSSRAWEKSAGWLCSK